MIILYLTEGKDAFDAGLFNNTIKNRVKSICEAHGKNNLSSYCFSNITTLLAFEVYSKKYNVNLAIYDAESKETPNSQEIYSFFSTPFLDLINLKDEILKLE